MYASLMYSLSPSISEWIFNKQLISRDQLPKEEKHEEVPSIAQKIHLIRTKIHYLPSMKQSKFKDKMCYLIIK